VTVVGGAVCVSVSVSGAWVAVVGLEPESEELEVLGETDSEGLVDEEVPLHPASARVNPNTTVRAVLRVFIISSTTEVR
jgi:hypothetical protein